MSDDNSRLFKIEPEYVIRDPMKTLLTIKPDGSIELGEGVTPDEAAKEFWNCVADAFPNFRDTLLAADPEQHAARQIERLRMLGRIGANHGGDGEKAPDAASIEMAIAFIRRWGLPDNVMTTVDDDGYACLEMHGSDKYAEILFRPQHTPADELREENERLRRLVERRDEFIISRNLWDQFKEALDARI